MNRILTSSEAKRREAPAGAVFLEKLGAWWCLRFHNSLYLPIHSQVRCRTCHRTRPVEWHEPVAKAHS